MTAAQQQRLCRYRFVRPTHKLVASSKTNSDCTIGDRATHAMSQCVMPHCLIS
jgi:hypothetical protein